MKLKIDGRRKTEKSTNMLKLNTLLNNQWLKEGIKCEIRKYLICVLKTKTQHTKTYELYESSTKKEVYKYFILKHLY
jgi:hypothetical protein